MREKTYYIEEISKMLARMDNDTTKAVYVALGRLTKGDFCNGIGRNQKDNHQ